MKPVAEFLLEWGLIQISFFRWFAESVPITLISNKLSLEMP